MYNLSDERVFGNVVFVEDPYCEWCCKEEEVFTMLWCDGEYLYCMECAKTVPGFNITEVEMKELKRLEAKRRLRYYKKKVKQLKKELGV